MSQDADALARAFSHASDHIQRLDETPVAATASHADLLRVLGRPLPVSGLPAAQVLDDLVRETRDGLNASQSGRFFSWAIGGGVPAAIGADWLTSVWDQNAGIFATAPAAAVVEEVAGSWLKEMFGLPPETSFAFVTGTQMGHVTCLAAARHAVLSARGWDVPTQGVFGAPRIRILAGADRHASVDRAARLLGFGSDAIEPLSVDGESRVISKALEAALAGRNEPVIVVLQAGELNLGAFDRFGELVPIARGHGAWVHVDGAFGLWAKVSQSHQHLVAGMELCDSWTTDGHKYLNTPYDSSFAFVRDAASHRAAISLGGVSYLPPGDGARDQIDWNPEFSRRARGFAAYAAIRQLGRDGIGELVERTCRHALALATRIGALPGAELLAYGGLNQGLVRFLSPAAGADETEHKARTDAVIAAINASGEAMFGGVTWRGKRAMRISVCNWRTNESDVDRAVAAAARALGINA